MNCPRCGTPNEPGDRFCTACGAQLQKAAPSKRQPPTERLGRFIGATRKARMASAGTAIAIIVAIISFFALKPKSEGVPRDSFTIAADHICLNAKRQIVLAGRNGGSTFARQLVPIVVNWRERLDALHVPSDQVEDTERLDAALREVEIEVATLARITERGNRARILARAKRADTTTTEVERAVSVLGLSECASAKIGFSAPG